MDPDLCIPTPPGRSAGPSHLREVGGDYIDPSEVVAVTSAWPGGLHACTIVLRDRTMLPSFLTVAEAVAALGRTA